MGVTADIASGPLNLKLGWLRPYRDETKDPDDEVVKSSDLNSVAVIDLISTTAVFVSKL